MKKTEYKTNVLFGYPNKKIWRRVYVDENGKRYVRNSTCFVCIEGTPCIEHITKVEVERED